MVEASSCPVGLLFVCNCYIIMVVLYYFAFNCLLFILEFYSSIHYLLSWSFLSITIIPHPRGGEVVYELVPQVPV